MLTVTAKQYCACFGNDDILNQFVQLKYELLYPKVKTEIYEIVVDYSMHIYLITG